MTRIFALTLLLALFGYGGAQSAECDPFAVAVATDPVPNQYPRGLEKAHTLLDHVPRMADVVLVGDSLVANWPEDMARRQFKSDRIWNFAVGGSVSQNTLWQLGKLKATGLEPAQVVVLVGTNNLTRDDMPACAIAAGIKAVVMAAHQKWPGAKLHVMGIPPRGMDFHFRDTVRLAINSEVEAWTKGFAYQHYFEVDASAVTCGQYDRPVQAVSAAARRLPTCANYADDFGHFKRAGYDVVFSAMMKASR